MNKNIFIVTGSSSMMGKATIAAIKKFYQDYEIVEVCRTTGFDLTMFGDSLNKLAPYYGKIAGLFHLAAFNGNVHMNIAQPADFYYNNIKIGLNTLEIARQLEVPKTVSIIPSCSYPDSNNLLKEKDFLNGPSHPSVDSHGHARRVFFEYSKYLHKQYNFNSVCVVINNSFGIEDSFDEGKTKVIGGLIKRFIDAKLKNTPQVVVWGSGRPMREFIYCMDVGNALVRTFESYNDPTEVLNVGTGTDITIKDLAFLISEIIGYKGEIIFDTTKADGAIKKLMDNTKMKLVLNWEPEILLEDGIKQTVDWYYSNILGK